MALETLIGPNAADFQTSTNYAGQYLAPGQNHLYSLSFTPQSLGFESAALTNYETPSPPFGGGILYLQADLLQCLLVFDQFPARLRFETQSCSANKSVLFP